MPKTYARKPVERPVVVVEGMPGAGKSTLLRHLAEVYGAITVPEFPGAVSPTGMPDSYALELHWGVWPAKIPYVRAAAREPRPAGDPVLVDRDWWTALGWENTTSGLLALADWAWDALGNGRLILPSLYVILDVPVGVSLDRRCGRLIPGHWWSDPAHLRRVRKIYANPVGHIRTVHEPLAHYLDSVPVLRLDATRPFAEVVDLVTAGIFFRSLPGAAPKGGDHVRCE